MIKLGPILSMICLFPLAATAQTHGQVSYSTPYAGLESHDIKSLSDADIGELRSGG